MNDSPTALVAEQTEKPPGTAYAIQTSRVTKSFGRKQVLKGIDLNVPAGSIYGLLGRNGTGKSTLIQILLGASDPNAGTVTMLGLDLKHNAIAVKRRLGYIPADLPLYKSMTVQQTLRFAASFYPNWKLSIEQDLIARFGLVLSSKVGTLSRGNHALLALVLAMAHEPDLVLLDECTSGMDAIARRDFERVVIDAMQSSGRTVLFASHQLQEVERICDWIGVRQDGKVILEMPMESLKSSVRMLRLSAKPSGETLGGDRRILQIRPIGREWLATVYGGEPLRDGDVLAGGVQVLETVPLTLEEIFVSLLGPGEERR